jgi:hypothetical protein
LGEPDEKSFGSAYVAEPIRVSILDHFAADKLRAVLAEPDQRIVDVVHSEREVVGVLLVIVGIRGDRRQARDIFSRATTVKVRAATRRVDAMPLTIKWGHATIQQQLRQFESRLRALARYVNERFSDESQRAKANLDEAVEAVDKSLHELDKELKRQLLQVLVGGVRGRFWGAVLVLAGIGFGTASNVVGNLS